MPSTTSQTIINNALSALGMLEQGGTPSVSDSTDALARLNMLLGQWRIQELFIWSVVLSNSALVANQGSYQIGPGGADFPQLPRPDYIEDAYIGLAGPNPANPSNHQLRIVSQQEYSAIVDRGAKGAIPERMYNDRASPFSTLFLYPIPRCATGTSLILCTWAQIADWPDLVTAADLPDGYAEAVSNALSVRLAPAFGAAVAQEVLQTCSALAQQAEQNIRALNAKARGIMLAPPAAPQGK